MYTNKGEMFTPLTRSLTTFVLRLRSEQMKVLGTRRGRDEGTTTKLGPPLGADDGLNSHPPGTSSRRPSFSRILWIELQHKRALLSSNESTSPLRPLLFPRFISRNYILRLGSFPYTVLVFRFGPLSTSFHQGRPRGRLKSS